MLPSNHPCRPMWHIARQAQFYVRGASNLGRARVAAAQRFQLDGVQCFPVIFREVFRIKWLQAPWILAQSPYLAPLWMLSHQPRGWEKPLGCQISVQFLVLSENNKANHCPFAQVGLTVLVDHSGKLFTRQKCTIKDIIVNQEVWDGHEILVQPNEVRETIHKF